MVTRVPVNDQQLHGLAITQDARRRAVRFNVGRIASEAHGGQDGRYQRSVVRDVLERSAVDAVVVRVEEDVHGDADVGNVDGFRGEWGEGDVVDRVGVFGHFGAVFGDLGRAWVGNGGGDV